jgi:putative phosphoesterase
MSEFITKNRCPICLKDRIILHDIFIALNLQILILTSIGLLSDTHNYLDDATLRHLDKCDEIWHAGDFGSKSIADKLSAVKPVKGVYGNIDGYDIRSIYPEILRWKCEDVVVLMTHIGGYPGKYSTAVKKELSNLPTQLFICGHSHILKIMYDPVFNCLHMNPGAAGKQGWHKVRTLIKFVIDGTDIRDANIIEMPR